MSSISSTYSILYFIINNKYNFFYNITTHKTNVNYYNTCILLCTALRIGNLGTSLSYDSFGCIIVIIIIIIRINNNYVIVLTIEYKI